MSQAQALPTRLKLFVDSSSAGPDLANLIAAGLTDVADVTTACDGIADASRTFDLAVFVLNGTQDAGVHLRLGMFLGALGRQRVVLVGPSLNGPDLPSELHDVSSASYAPYGGGNDVAGLESVCMTIREHVQRLATPVGQSTPASSTDPRHHVARRMRRSLGTARSVRSGQTLRIADISVTGALLETYGEIPEHQLLDLVLDLEGGRRVGVTAKVVRIQYPQWGRVGGVGVAFTRFEGDSRDVLERFLEPAP
jgi:hypothetical protein